MITTKNISLSDPLSNILKIKKDDKKATTNTTSPTSNSNTSNPENAIAKKRIQVPQSSSEFLDAWISKLITNSLTSLYILPFRQLNSNDFIRLFNAIADCTSLNVLTISGHDFGPECHSALTRALSTNASIITIDIGSNVLGLCTEEIETLTASNNNCIINTTNSNIPNNNLKKGSSLSALLNSSSSASLNINNNNNDNSEKDNVINPNAIMSHMNSDSTLVPPSPPSLSLKEDEFSSLKGYSTSTPNPNFIHQVSSALSRNLQSYTQTQNYLSSSQGVFNYHKENIAKNHLYGNHKRSGNDFATVNEDENDINEPDNLESFKAICTGIGMNQSIQHWNLDYKSIGFRASEVLAERVLLYNKTIVKLSLARNHLGDKGCIAICNALIQSNNCTLKYLNLKDNDIGPEGMGEKGIAGLLKAFFHVDFTSTQDSGSNGSESTSLPSHPKFLTMTPLTPPNSTSSIAQNPTTALKVMTREKSGGDVAKSVTINDIVDIDFFSSSFDQNSIENGNNGINCHHHSRRHGSTSSMNLLSTSYSSTISNSSTCSNNTTSHTHCGIRELNLACNPIGDEGGVLIGEALKYNTSLRELNLSNTDIGDDTIISICKNIESTLPPNTQVEDPSESPPRCTRIQHTSRLLKFYANNNHIGAQGCEALSRLLEKNPRICYLSLKGNHFGDEGVKKLISKLSIKSKHRSTSSTSNNVAALSTSSDYLATPSTSIPINKKDHRYSIGSNVSSCSSYNSVNGWTYGGTTTKSPTSASASSNGGSSWCVFGINSLSLSNEGSSLWGKGESSDQELSRHNSLSNHEMSSSYYQDNYSSSSLNNTFSSSSSSSNQCKNTHLTSLYLSNNDITMKGFIDLVQSCPNLKLLDLHNNSIYLTEKDDFSTVIKKFGLNKLNELYLSDNKMGVTDLKLICKMLQSGLTPKLEELILTGNVSVYDDEAYDEWEERINKLEVNRPCLSITWR